MSDAGNAAEGHDFQIRNAVFEDMAVIHEIYKHHITTSIVSVRDDAPGLAEMQTSFISIKRHAHSPYIVAEETLSGTVCGFAYAQDYMYFNSGHQRAATDTIYVASEACGKGIGTLLLQALLARLRESGKKKVVIAKINVRPEEGVEDVPSCRLHRALGFQEVGRLRSVGEKFGALVDELLMQRNID